MKAAAVLKRIYKPKYLALNAAVFGLYYLIVKYLLSIQQKGIPISSVPVYLVYALVASSSIALTIAVYSIFNTRRNSARITASSVSAATTLAGGVIAGCSCQAAILFNVLAISVGSGEAFALNTLISENAPYIFGAMTLINLLLVVYYVQKISTGRCSIK